MKRFLAYVATGSLLVAGCTETNLFEENITQSDASLGERSMCFNGASSSEVSDQSWVKGKI